MDLVDGHYVAVSMSLQGQAAPDHVDGSVALDLAIARLSERASSELDTAAERTAIKAALAAAIQETYGDRVTDVEIREFLLH